MSFLNSMLEWEPTLHGFGWKGETNRGEGRLEKKKDSYMVMMGLEKEGDDKETYAIHTV